MSQPVYVLTLRALKDATPAVLRLRQLLKYALRSQGLRCECYELTPAIAAQRLALAMRSDDGAEQVLARNAVKALARLLVKPGAAGMEAINVPGGTPAGGVLTTEEV